MDPKKKPPVAKGIKKKGVKKVKKKAQPESGSSAKKPKAPKDDFKLMSLDEIENLFDQKNVQFEKRLKEYFKIKVQPLTLKLICKHAFLQKLKQPVEVEEDSEPSTQAATEDVPDMTPKPKIESDSDGLEDQEAIIISEKKKIDEVLIQSKQNFLEKAGRPIISRRLGVGLAAVVAAKMAPKVAEFKKKEKEDADEYYQEDSDSYYNEEEEKIGHGYDEDSDIDLTEFTEEDVTAEKLRVMHEQLESDYQRGFDPEKDPEKLIELKNLRLSFLNVGPKLQNLEFFEGLETLYLQYNQIETIGINSLQFNINLQMLNISNNKISEIEGISHLKQLYFLDLSFNQIEKVSTSQIPNSIMILRLNNNPVEDYRKPMVVYLDDLTELDKIKVVQAERLWYKGLLPKQLGYNVQQQLKKFKQQREEEQAGEKLEFELYKEMMDHQGVSAQQRTHQSIDQFEELNKEGLLQNQFEQIMEKMKDSKDLIMKGHKHRQEQISEAFEGVLKKYPGSKKAKKYGGVEAIQEMEGEDEEEEEEEQDFDQYSKEMDDKAKNQAFFENKIEGMLTEKKLDQAKGNVYQIDSSSTM